MKDSGFCPERLEPCQSGRELEQQRAELSFGQPEQQLAGQPEQQPGLPASPLFSSPGRKSEVGPPTHGQNPVPSIEGRNVDTAPGLVARIRMTGRRSRRGLLSIRQASHPEAERPIYMTEPQFAAGGSRKDWIGVRMACMVSACESRTVVICRNLLLP